MSVYGAAFWEVEAVSFILVTRSVSTVTALKETCYTFSLCSVIWRYSSCGYMQTCFHSKLNCSDWRFWLNCLHWMISNIFINAFHQNSCVTCTNQGDMSKCSYQLCKINKDFLNCELCKATILEYHDKNIQLEISESTGPLNHVGVVYSGIFQLLRFNVFFAYIWQNW